MIYRKIFLSIFLTSIIILSGVFPNNLYSQSINEKANQLLTEDRALNFLIISDWGRDGINDTDSKAPGQQRVAKQLGMTAEEINPSFVITCGDNFHGKGVSSPSDPLWKVNFENVYTANSLMIPWYITLGNHDYEGNVEAELEYAKTSKRWIETGRYFDFIKYLPDSTEVLFVILDSTPFIQEYLRNKNDKYHIKNQNTNEQLRWCDSVLSTSKAKWKFVFFHHPAYSASSKHGSTKEIQIALVPLFKKYHVDACFSGHDHDLQHSRPENSTIEYFGVGGGSEVRPTGQARFTRFSRSSLGFGVVSLNNDTMKFSFVSDTGERLYTYEIQK